SWVIGVTCCTVAGWNDDATTVGCPSAGVVRGACAVGPLVGENDGGTACTGGENAVVAWTSSRPAAPPGTPPGGGGGGTGAFGDMLCSSRAPRRTRPARPGGGRS